MTDNQKQPREYDVVLGGQKPPPTNSVVLGGIEGVKMRLSSNVEKARLDAISEATKYGDAGLDLVIEALKDQSYSVKKTAVSCLWDLQETPRIKQALIASHPWLFFESLYPPLQHSADVYSLGITPDGKTLLSGSADGTIKFWDLNSGQVIRSVGRKGYSGEVLSLAISPNAKTLVASFRPPYEHTFRTFDIQSGKWKLYDMEQHSSHVLSIAIAPNGNTIVGGSEDSTIAIWNFRSKKLRQVLQGHSDKVSSVAITTDSKTLVSGSADSTIKVWHLKSGTLVKTLEGHSDKVSSVAITTDSKILVSGSADSTIKVWDLKSGTLVQTLEGHLNSVTSVAVAPDSKSLVSGSLDRSIKIWDLASGELKKTITGNLPEIYAVAIAPNGKTIFSGGDGSTLTGGRSDNTISIWDLDSGQLLRNLEGHPVEIPSVAITPNGKTLLSGSADSTVKVWDLDSGQLLRTLKSHLRSVLSLAIAPDGKTVARPGKDSDSDVADAERQEVVALAERQKIVSGSRDSYIAIWDLDSGELVNTFKGAPYWGVKSLAISPDGKTLFSGGWRGVRVFWLGRTSYQTSHFLAPDSIDTMAIAPDGKTLLGHGYVWDLQPSFRTRGDDYTFAQTRDGRTLKAPLSCLAIAPDSKTVVGGTRVRLEGGNTKYVIALWDLQSGRQLRTLEGHSGSVNSVAITTDGNTIVSGSADNTIKIWDFHSGDLLRTLEGHSDAVNSVAVTTDGKTIVSSSNDCTVRVWGIK